MSKSNKSSSADASGKPAKIPQRSIQVADDDYTKAMLIGWYLRHPRKRDTFAQIFSEFLTNNEDVLKRAEEEWARLNPGKEFMP